MDMFPHTPHCELVIVLERVKTERADSSEIMQEQSSSDVERRVQTKATLASEIMQVTDEQTSRDDKRVQTKQAEGSEIMQLQMNKPLVMEEQTSSDGGTNI